MKFAKIMEEIKNKEENKGKIVLARCGAFIIAIGNDAILLSKLYGLKLTCFQAQVCKVGIPVTHTLKYLELIEKSGYSKHNTYNNIDIFELLKQRQDRNNKNEK